VPALDPDHRTEVAPLAGDPPNPINPPSGCRFHPRCALAAPVCGQRVPRAVPAGALHAAACLVQEPGSGHPLAPSAALAA
jgi:peptide/nickel transport system ATP-binding protein